MGNPTGSTEQASSQRSAQLDLAAQATHNVERSRQGIAQQYQSVYDERGWKQHGPVPAAVLDAERAPPTSQQAPVPAARATPSLTPQQIEAVVAPRAAVQESHPSRLKPTPGGMSFAEAHQRRDEPEKISPGSLQPVDKLPKADRQHELTLLREIGIVNARTVEELGKPSGTPWNARPPLERMHERAPQPAVQQAPTPRQATPPQSQPPRAPSARDSPSDANDPTVTTVAGRSAAAALQTGNAESPATHARVAALEEQIARPFDPRDASHPHHRDFQKIYTAVSQDGRWDAKQSTNIASQVLADFKADPMGKRLDVIAIEPDLKGQLKVFAGHAPWGAHKGLMGTTVVDPGEAARMPAELGFERLAQASQQHQHQDQQRAQQQAHDHGRGL